MSNPTTSPKPAVLAVVALLLSAAAPPSDDTVVLPAGRYRPFYAADKTASGVAVPAFRMDAHPVTNGQFLAFVIDRPEWRKSQLKAIFADNHYLANWPSDTRLAAPDDADRPVTNVSWFAAKAYCEWRGKTLPTTDQWEYALADQGRDQDAVRQRILAWYAAANPERLPQVGRGRPNGYGLYDLTGLVWEWTLDFAADNSAVDDKGGGKFCAGASLGARDASDYAAFMRYSMRASLGASYTTNNLGFRCAGDAS